MAKTTWNKKLRNVLEEGETVIAKAPADESVWDREFDDSYGRSEGDFVLAWTENYVYFPVVYDGSEWLECAPRNPQAEGQGHVGGE